jgi:hypothetical protein
MNCKTRFSDTVRRPWRGTAEGRNGMTRQLRFCGQTPQEQTREPASLRGAASAGGGRWRTPLPEKSCEVGRSHTLSIHGRRSGAAIYGRGAPSKTRRPCGSRSAAAPSLHQCRFSSGAPTGVSSGF